MRRTLLWIAPLLATISAAATAQDAANDQTVVVIGKRQSSTKEAERFVRQVIATDTGQLPRFIEPVCPNILGVPASTAAALGDRLRRTAAAGGVPLAPEGCANNLLMVIAADADSFIKVMRKKYPSFFADLSDVDVRDAFRSGVVHAWRLVETRDEDGRPVTGDPPVVDSYSSGVFSLPTQAAAVNAVVVIDKKVVLDKTIAQLADYVAMRALAGARPPKKDAVGETTILSLFDAGATPPKEMTSMDRSLLSGLYAIDGSGTSMGQLHRLSRHMAGDRRK